MQLHINNIVMKINKNGSLATANRQSTVEVLGFLEKKPGKELHETYLKGIIDSIFKNICGAINKTEELSPFPSDRNSDLVYYSSTYARMLRRPNLTISA